MNNKKFLTVQDMVLIAVFVAIITVCSFIQISVGPVPFTLQTFGVFVTAGILGTKRGTLAVIVYILLGIIGVPVFCGAGGPGVIVGTTGGYITGFIFTALYYWHNSLILRKEFYMVKHWSYSCSYDLGDVVCFVIGTIQFMFVMKDFIDSGTWGYCVIPFIYS